MQEALKAVIFDMDGVLIDSEPLWRRAMIQGFTEAGMPFTEDDCRKTMGIRIGEVVRYWLGHFELLSINPQILERRIVSLLLELIDQEGRLIPGVDAILALCRKKNIKQGLATSSSNQLMQAILNKLQLTQNFDAVISAEHMKYGKPHPEVFLACADRLGIAPNHCLVIEDSLNGVIAAKAAQMRVLVVPEEPHRHNARFAVADYHMSSMPEALALFKNLWP